MARMHGLTTALFTAAVLAHSLLRDRSFVLITARAGAARRRGDRGATLVEYTLMIALIALVCVSAVSVMGRQAGSSITNSGNSMFGP